MPDPSLEIYAHSVPGHPKTEWEPLRDHLRLVAESCARFADVVGWAALGHLLGRLHDAGKYSAAFQAYIAAADEHKPARGPDHSTAGAREAVLHYGPTLGRIAAFIIAGHHGGLNGYASKSQTQT